VQVNTSHQGTSYRWNRLACIWWSTCQCDFTGQNCLCHHMRFCTYQQRPQTSNF